MKRVKAACIFQTLVFMQKEDCGLDKETQYRYNREEVEKYKNGLVKNRTQYRIVKEEEQSDGSIVIEIIKQYNTSPVGDYLK